MSAEAVAKESLRWVERLLEPDSSDGLLREAAQHLTQSHYCDVVEERNIGGLCGWPGCEEHLGLVPKQKYHISLERKVVVDLTERKVTDWICELFPPDHYMKFCSPECYRASKFYSLQLSPAHGPQLRRGVPVQLLPTRPKGQQQRLQSQTITLSSPFPRSPPLTKQPSPPHSPPLTKQPSPPQSPPLTKQPSPPNSQALSKLPSPPHSPPLTKQPSPPHSPPLTKQPSPPHSPPLTKPPVLPQMPSEMELLSPDVVPGEPQDDKWTTVQRPKLSSVGRLLHAFSSWCTPATFELIQNAEQRGKGVGEGGGGRIQHSGEAFLPPVHSVTQKQLQRNIFLQQLKRNLSGVVGPLGITVQQTLPSLIALTDTFSLDRHTIMFRPSEWKVLILVLLLSSQPVQDFTHSHRPIVDQWLSAIAASHTDLHIMMSTLVHTTPPDTR